MNCATQHTASIAQVGIARLAIKIVVLRVGVRRGLTALARVGEIHATS
jgi:hypothetical protein